MEPEVTRVEVEGQVLKLTSLSKIMYPDTGTTKGEVLNYYAQIAPALLPGLRDRCLTRVRWPHGVAQDSFFEKNIPAGAPSWIRRANVDKVDYPICDDLATLTYLANLNSLELHVNQWRVDDSNEPLNPDRIVIDLDPGKGADTHECAQVALAVRERLGALGMELQPVTSGSKGIQLYARLGGDLTSEQVRDLAQQLAQELTAKMPELVVWKMTTSLRPGKVLIDWSQNVQHKTTIAPYSLRGKSEPTVALPRTWAEIEAGAARRGALTQAHFKEALERIGESRTVH